MRMIGGRRVIGGLVALLLAVGGALGVLAASSGATRPVANPAAAARLGSVTALAWGVRTPVGARLVLGPSVSFNLSPRALRLLRARKPRLSGSFRARIVTAPVRGRSRTLAVVSRRVSGLALGTSALHSVLGSRLRLRQWVLSRKQTRAVKRAAARGPLALAFSSRYRVSYINARGRTVLTPTRSGSVTLPFALKRRQARGGNLRELASTFRALLGRVGQLKTACGTRNEIVEQLRNTYGVMASGDRSTAKALLQLYISDAGTMQSAGLLGRQQASMLASGLGGLRDRVGSGQSKRVERARRWRALPSCGPVRAHSAQTLVAIIVRRVAKRVHKVIKKLRRRVMDQVKDQIKDKLVDEIKDNLWPEDTSQPSVNDQVPSGQNYSTAEAQQALDGLKAQVQSFTAWEECCLATQPDQVASSWNSVIKNFEDNRWRFEPATPYYPVSFQVQMLPTLAEYTNQYLSMLREGILNGTRWGMAPDAVMGLENKIRAELNPNSPSAGCGSYTCAGGNATSYTKKVYNDGLAQLGSSASFAKTNEYKRENQIGVLDLMDMWHLQDPMGYPFGDPGFKQDRMILSDPVGTTTQTFAAPANPSSPLSALTVWTTRVTTGSHNNQNWVTAIQADNSPQVGARTGAAGGTATKYPVTPDTIVQVDTTYDQKSSSAQKVIGTVRLTFSDGGVGVPGGDFYDRGTCNSTPPCTASWAFDDEVLAAAKIMGSYQITSGTAVGDQLLLGFRQADSFTSQWKGSLPGLLRAPNTQACLGVEQVSITSGTTGSRANGAAMQMRGCSSTAWDQIWKYVDYDEPDDPNDDAAQHELTVYGGTMCAAPKAGATTAGTPVQVYYCDGTPAQHWTRRADGTITNDQSSLCLTRAGGAVSVGTPLLADTCNGGAGQKWNWT